ncbi:hypothetical protein BgiMline_002431, partial [Biomphalaria glabrata]
SCPSFSLAFRFHVCAWTFHVVGWHVPIINTRETYAQHYLLNSNPGIESINEIRSGSIISLELTLRGLLFGPIEGG